MKIAVIVLNYNGERIIFDCLNSLYQLSIINNQLSIIIVDNASIDNSVSLIRKKFPKVKLIVNEKNLGFAKGNNVGIRYALENKADYILILNNDTLINKTALIQLIEVMESNKKIGIVSPKIYFASGYEYHKKRYSKIEQGRVIWYSGGLIDWQNVLASHRGVDEVDNKQYDKVEETDFATGCAMLIKKQVFEKIGLFDPKYFLYWEDIDFCQRVKKAGFKIVYAPKAVVWHKNAASSGGAGGNLSVYYQTRNRMFFALKYAPIRSKLAVLKEGFKDLFSKNKWRKKAVKDFFFLNFGKIK